MEPGERQGSRSVSSSRGTKPRHGPSSSEETRLSDAQLDDLAKRIARQMHINSHTSKDRRSEKEFSESWQKLRGPKKYTAIASGNRAPQESQNPQPSTCQSRYIPETVKDGRPRSVSPISRRMRRSPFNNSTKNHRNDRDTSYELPSELSGDETLVNDGPMHQRPKPAQSQSYNPPPPQTQPFQSPPNSRDRPSMQPQYYSDSQFQFNYPTVPRHQVGPSPDEGYSKASAGARHPTHPTLHSQQSSPGRRESRNSRSPGRSCLSGYPKNKPTPYSRSPSRSRSSARSTSRSRRSESRSTDGSTDSHRRGKKRYIVAGMGIAAVVASYEVARLATKGSKRSRRHG